ncbi:DNA topoisomerase IB [Parasphingorhabdus sp.]|uniref:DNA topoisomerase IB n=1 Tax=Parasphingorhabdus sp. TaxID=2709688 RepID=UPI002F91EAA0
MLPDGSTLKSAKHLQRIKGLGLPPAYTDVWICTKPNGHIQATGFDSASRKQYHYHDDWTEFRNRQKFERLADFAKCLPRIRRRIDTLMNEAGKSDRFSKEISIAAVVRLIDRTAIRIGGRSKSSQGATTLKMSNVKYEENILRLRYRAKGGKRVQMSLRDTKLQTILEEVHDLPGKRLFQYIGENGDVYPLDSADVNQWLKEVGGMEDISAKMFRTWQGSVAGLDAVFRETEPTIKLACEAASKVLRNTPSICRSSYIHPAVISLIEMQPEKREKKLKAKFERIRGLRVAESRLVNLIRHEGK